MTEQMTQEKTIPNIKELVKKWEGKEGNLIMILHEIQHHSGYVPREISFELAKELDLPLARIYEVLTFYSFFKLTPPGKYKISVCMGTACYLKGGPDILEELENVLGVKEGVVTDDGLFLYESVRCIGCCGLAPVLMINDKVYGKVKKEEIVEIISTYTKEA